MRSDRVLVANLQGDHQGVLSRAEQVHGVYESIVNDDDQPEDKEGCVLQYDCDKDPPHIQITANLLGFLTSRGIQIHDFILKKK